MKTENKQRWLTATLLAAACIAFFSFSSPAGGDVVEIYRNDELMVRQYLHADRDIKTVSLQKAKAGDQLKVYYSHCGANGKNRSIFLKNEQGKELKKWQYADVSGSARSMMNCSVRDIFEVQKSSSGKLKLYYASKEIPGGKLLAGIAAGNANSANP